MDIGSGRGNGGLPGGVDGVYRLWYADDVASSGCGDGGLPGGVDGVYRLWLLNIGSGRRGEDGLPGGVNGVYRGLLGGPLGGDETPPSTGASTSEFSS